MIGFVQYVIQKLFIFLREGNLLYFFPGLCVIHSTVAMVGVMSITRALAVEWDLQLGIRMNGIAQRSIGRTGCANRLYSSEVYAGLTVFIMYDKASYMNGEIAASITDKG